MNKIFVFVIIPLIFLFITGFISDIPVDVERVNFKLSDDEIAITFFALSSGEATLIQHALAGNVLVNTGGPNTKEELKELLKMYNITDLSAIIITKDQPEYIHNLNWLLKNYHVNEVIVGSQVNDFAMKLATSKITLWKKGDNYEILPNLIVHVLHENGLVYGKNGMDLSFKYGNHHILYMSTADRKIESELAKQDLTDVNILKVADFASEKGTTQVFLDSVDPQVAVIFKKKGILPSDKVIERLHETWIDIYQTSKFGNVSVKLSPDHYEVITIALGKRLREQ